MAGNERSAPTTARYGVGIAPGDPRGIRVPPDAGADFRAARVARKGLGTVPSAIQQFLPLTEVMKTALLLCEMPEGP